METLIDLNAVFMPMYGSDMYKEPSSRANTEAERCR